MRRCSFALLVSLLVLPGSACKVEPTPAPLAPDQGAIDLPSELAPPKLSSDAIEAVVAFLADDAQRGRAPGTDADARVQAWIIERMKAAGLEPGLPEGYLQRFEVGDGVRLREGAESRLAGIRGEPIAHAIVPFGHDTGTEQVTAPLVFVGHDGFAKAKLDGAIAVAWPGSADPHASSATTRPQSKLIAARDAGAVGFVLWDPNSDIAPPNHGPYSELEIPAVFVGKSGNEAMGKALRLRGDAVPKVGDRSRAKFELGTPIEAVTLTTANVIGLLPGSGAAAERKRIIVGAHMDHLGLGTSSSLAPGEHAIHNGADDNASGVAVLLGIAEALARVSVEHRPHDVVFVAFGAEEMGLLGSKHMVEAMTEQQRARVLAMLNFDMVGRLRDSLIVNGTGTAQEWAALLERVSLEGEDQLNIESMADGWGPSDHASFYGEGVPVLHFFTGAHTDYHKPSDDLDKLNAVGAAAIGELAARITLELMDRDEPLTYVKVERPSPGRTAFRVSLGTMPDYGRDVDGLALAGVREGGPAAAAGLQKDDVITRIGTREVHNIDDYMVCFGELEPGVAVELEFERDGKVQTTELVPAAPVSRR